MLRARVFTALALLGLLLAALFLLPELGWLAFVALVIFAAAREWGALVRYAPAGQWLYGLFAALVFVAVGGWAAARSFAIPIYVVACGFWLVAIPFWLERKWVVSSAPVGALVGLVVLVPAGLALIDMRTHAPLLVLGTLAAVWVADIAAYFAGRAFGRRKLAPGISPGKTWEGAWGALAGVLIYGLTVGAGAGWLSGGMQAWALLAGGLILFVIISICGDLFESLMKRQAGLKDSGTLLPGHGGVLDRIDSLTSTLPFVGLSVVLINR